MTTQTGTLAEEATRLLGAVDQWWRDRAAGDRSAGAPDADTPGGAAGAGPFADAAGHRCTACPLCQLLTSVRTAHPDTVEHLLAAAGSLAGALRSLLDASDPQWKPGPRPPVQRITIREGDQ